MKCSLLTLIFISLISSFISLKRRINKDLFDEAQAKQYSYLLSKLSCAKSPINQTCTDCLQTNDGNKLYYYFQSKRLLKHLYKVMIHLNDNNKKVLITIAGPSLNNKGYINYIYTTGFRKNKQYGFKLETEYSRVYFHIIRDKLIKKVKEILKTKGKSDYRFDFAGHSIGGSISLLAAYDLIKTGTINQKIHEPKVYTYGQLRIGDNNFVKSVSKILTNLFRIVKKDDFIIRVPNCYYNKKGSSWKCLQLNNMSEQIEDPSSNINKYLKEYNTEEGEPNNMEKFKKNMYYSQAFGTLIMYDEKMEKQVCKANNNIKEFNSCEENINLPSVFSDDSHLNYFGHKYGYCK